MIRQHYLKNTAILRTEMEDARGGRVEVIDFAPRFYQHGRVFAPVGLVRIVRNSRDALACVSASCRAPGMARRVRP